MSFDLDDWKKQIEIELENWVPRMKDAGVESVYAFLSASALWPLVKRAKEGDITTYVTLGDIAGATGANLIVNQIQNWTGPNFIAKYLEENLEFMAVEN